MASRSQPEFTIKKAILERQRFHKSMRVKNDEAVLGLFAVDSMEGEVEYDIDFNEWIVRMEMDVLAEHLADHYYEETLILSAPKSWWDHFKATYQDRWWIRWWCAKHPAQETRTSHKVKVKVERWVKYPEANETLPRLGRAIPYEKLERIY